MRKLSNYINAKWVEPQTTLEISSPVDKKKCLIPQSETTIVEKAIESAVQSFPQWRTMTVKSRVQKLQQFKEAIQPDTPLGQKIINSIMEEIGKPYVEAETEIIEVSDIISYFASIAETALSPQKNPIDETMWMNKESFTLYEPRGVIGIIKPWNYPFSNPLWAITSALITGNTVVFKPSEYSSQTGLLIAEALDKVQLPAGVFNVVCGDGRVGKQIVKHTDVNFIAFTGSVPIGREIQAQCVATGKGYSLELGGNDPAIVMEDANLELAINGIMWGAFTNAGQVCTAIKRVFVHQNIITKFVDSLTEKTNSLRQGQDVGPVIEITEAHRVLDFIEDAKANGGTIKTGGKIITDTNYIIPTIIVDCNTNMRLFSEEVFGPILPIFVYTDLSEVIDLLNQGQYGLGASIWTSNTSKAFDIAKQLDVGMVWVNDVNLPFPQAPWTGRKDSGPGVELSYHGLVEFCNKKHICIDSGDNIDREWWFPY